MNRLARLRPLPTRPVAAAVTGIALLALSGCGSAAGQSAAALTDVDLVHNGALTVCTDMPYAPFEYKENGKPTGFDIELVQQVADSLEVDLDVIDVSFDDITSGTSLNTDVCDVAISAMTITGERARVIDFSSPYFDAKQALVTPRGSGLDELAELGGKRVGVQAETTGETFLSDFAPSTTMVVPYEDAALLEKAIVSGEVDAAIYDNTVSGQITSTNAELKVAREFDTGEQYGMAVKKDGNIPLLRRINGSLAELRESGVYDKIFTTYFG